MAMIPEELKNAAGNAFHAYEEVLISRIVRRAGWRLDAAPLFSVLATGDETKVRAFIEDMERGRKDLLDAVIAGEPGRSF